jgi:hypothetical protein
MTSTTRAWSVRRRSWRRLPYATSCVRALPEGVLRIGEEAHLVEQLGGLESGQPVPQRVLVCLVRDGLQ